LGDEIQKSQYATLCGCYQSTNVQKLRPILRNTEFMRSFQRKRITQKCQNFPIFGITPWRPRGCQSIVTWQFVSPTDCALRIKISARYLEGLRKYLRGSKKQKWPQLLQIASICNIVFTEARGRWPPPLGKVP